MFKKVILVLVLAGCCMLLVSCQTVSGIGKDITWSAEATADLLEGE